MELSASQIAFIRKHAADDLNRLLLSVAKYPEMDIPFLVEQIAARKQIKDKLPSWSRNESMIFPSKLAAEQCSSEQTALYKQRLIEKDWTVCDLTGGLGVDTFFMSRKVSNVFYFERFPTYCEAARNNFSQLGADNITVYHADCVTERERLPEVDLFYIDPARRGEGNRRVFALSDCEPDLPRLLPFLFKKAPLVIAKISPMADIRMTLSLLPGTTSIHVLSVRNECKELLFVVERSAKESLPQVCCVHFATDGSESNFRFTLEEERETEIHCVGTVGAFLYEPNASILKAGAFKQIAVRFGVDKLHPNSHLYTSEKKIDCFPGRIFKVEEMIPFSGKICKTFYKTLPQANMTVRNFPLSVAELRQRTRIKDGGNDYLFATTLAGGEKVLIRCRNH